jgi:pimeloyl-ACP methyl ester carboxylesterase
MKTVATERVEIACETYGDRNTGDPVILLHGFPDDASAWRRVGSALASAGYYALAPYTRGCGPSRFRRNDIPKSGQVAARMRDLQELMDALGVTRALLVGQDWGAATAQALSMLHPERVERLVLLNGHGLFNMAVFAQGKLPSWQTIHAGWYQWLFATPIGRPVLEADREGLARYLWERWSPGWDHPPEDLEAVLGSISNPDWVAVAISAYQQWQSDPSADPVDADASAKLAATPPIHRPTLNIQGARDAVDLPADTHLGQEAFYRGGLESVVLEGCGHFLHRERPDAVAQLILDFFRR